MEEKRGSGRPRKNNDNPEVPELSDTELARFANALSRTFAAVLHTSDILQRKLRLESEVAMLEGRAEVLKPGVDALEARKAELESRLSSVEQEIEAQLASERHERVGLMQADIDKEVEGYRDAAETQKANIQNDLEKAREEAEAEKAAIKELIAAERKNSDAARAETKILQDALFKLRQNIATGANDES